MKFAKDILEKIKEEKIKYNDGKLKHG